jgi:dTMP kinase
MSKLICLEGPDGAGKTTQLRMLKDAYPDAVITREPGGTEYGEQIRQLIFQGENASAESLFMLFWAARAEHVEKLIAPKLQQGVLVITDRFDLSTFAYQLRGQLNTKKFDKLFWTLRHELVISPIAVESPHYIYLDMDVETSIARLEERAGEVTHFDKQAKDFHERVRNGGHEFISEIGRAEFYCHMIDAAWQPEVVHRDIVATVEKIIAT